MGLVFPNILSSADGSQSLTDEGRRNFVVNMPTVVGSGAGGGPFFGLASDTERLTRRLATAELDGLLKSVSVSNATTVDHSPTTMSQNVRIPFGVVSAGNGNSDAIDDRIVATVMPQVIADGSVLMQITINATNQLTRVNGSTGQWPLFSREWSVRMLVKPGSTMAIGGLVTHCIIESDCEVPLYSRIPLIGRLIRDLLRPEPKDPCVEVMMFVTPRIINRAQSVVSSTDP